MCLFKTGEDVHGLCLINYAIFCHSKVFCKSGFTVSLCWVCFLLESSVFSFSPVRMAAFALKNLAVGTAVTGSVIGSYYALKKKRSRDSLTGSISTTDPKDGILSFVPTVHASASWSNDTHKPVSWDTNWDRYEISKYFSSAYAKLLQDRNGRLSNLR